MASDNTSGDLVRHPIVRVIAGALSGGSSQARALLRRHGFDRVHHDDAYAVTALARYNALFEDAAALLGEPALGLRLGRSLSPSELGPLGIYVVNQPDLRHALGAFTSHISALQGGTSVEVIEESDIAQFSYRIQSPGIWPRRQDAEFSIATTCAIVRALLGGDWRPLDVHFEHERGAGAAALEGYFGVAPRFGESSNRLVFARGDLDRAASGGGLRGISSASLLPFIERHLNDLSLDSGPRDIVAQVSAAIERRLGRMPLSVDSVAADLGLPVRSLQRALARRQTSFGELVRHRREARANLLLAAGELNLADIAGELGYADATAFSRAYKGWTGHPPRGRRARSTRAGATGRN
ncbi:MAG: AraC family transcriptional regulator [Xanthobacteraceae bacterium]